MSREVDMSDLDSLSDEDLTYLHARDKVSDAVLVNRGLDPYVHQGVELPLEEQPHTGDANTAGLTKEEHEAQVAAQAEAEASEGVEYDEEVDYHSMSNDDLRAEIARRNMEDGKELSLEGRKSTLVATLEADDQENSEEG